jgi:Tol biopolymer transport system component
VSLSAGTRLGPYVIESAAGAGGMGEVYQARDTRLDRVVAIKVLPSHLSSDPALRQRFEREARAISALTHPNICTLHDVGRENGVDFLVMEYLEGETLGSRLLRGPMPLSQLCPIAQEIAEALDAAHRKGLVHRDLKPGNIMLTRSGTKLLDFGLAKAAAATAGAAANTSLPTEAQPASPLTGTGVMVGTVHYMSPEQVEGKDADARSDIFALGAVMYEMASGQRPFEGRSQFAIATAILEKDPEPLSAVQPLSPPALEHLIQTCLAKDPEHRWQSAADVSRGLKWIATAGSKAGVPAVARTRSRARRWWLAAATVLGVIAAFAAGQMLHEPPSRAVIRAAIPAPEGLLFLFDGDAAGPPALSPDGSKIAYLAMDESGNLRLRVRENRTGDTRTLESAGWATFPFWSPDGRSITYFPTVRTYRISAEGGSPELIANSTFVARGGAWLPDGSLLLSPNPRSGIVRIRSAGATPEPVTTLESWQTTHRWPVALPDGKHFLYFATAHTAGVNPAHPPGIYFASLEKPGSRFVVATDAQAEFADGHLFYMREGRLVAQPFDPATGTLSGDATVIAEEVRVDPSVWRAVFAVSGSGVLVYQGGKARGGATVAFLDREGKTVRTMFLKTGLQWASLSADGSTIATEANPSNTIWVYDTLRGTGRGLTISAAAERSPLFTSDGRTIYYLSETSETTRDLKRRPASGMGTVETLMHFSLIIPAISISGDGRYFAGTMVGSGRPAIEVYDLENRELIRRVSGPANYRAPEVSPDGSWVAYLSDQTGQNQVYVTGLRQETSPIQVSLDGADQVVWTGEGRELCFTNGQNLQCSRISGSGGAVQATPPKFLFALPKQWDPGNTFLGATRSGDRFVVPIIDPGASTPIQVIVNWKQLLKR